jgi:hypothetical protein
MSLVAAAVVSLVVLVPLCAVAMRARAASASPAARAGSQPSRSGPVEWFTGAGWVQHWGGPVPVIRPGAGSSAE